MTATSMKGVPKQRLAPTRHSRGCCVLWRKQWLESVTRVCPQLWVQWCRQLHCPHHLCAPVWSFWAPTPGALYSSYLSPVSAPSDTLCQDSSSSPTLTLAVSRQILNMVQWLHPAVQRSVYTISSVLQVNSARHLQKSTCSSDITVCIQS